MTQDNPSLILSSPAFGNLVSVGRGRNADCAAGGAGRRAGRRAGAGPLVYLFALVIVMPLKLPDKDGVFEPEKDTPLFDHPLFHATNKSSQPFIFFQQTFRECSVWR